MAYNAPSDPVGGTVITVAAYVSNSLDNIRWLRLLTGNADPPGSAYVVVSTSTSGTSWQKIPTDAIAAAAITNALMAALSVGTAQLIDLAVVTAKINDLAVTAGKVNAGGTASRVMRTTDGAVAAWGQILDADVGIGQLAGNKLQNNTLTTTQVQDGSLLGADMAPNAIGSTQLSASASVDADRAVSGDHIKNNAVPARAMGTNSVTEPALDMVNAPSDGQYLQYVTASGRMQWNSPLVNNGVTEPMLDMTNAPSDDQVIVYDTGTSKMFWDQIRAANVAAGVIAESHLDINNSPADAQLLAWNAAASKLSWVAPPSGTGGIPPGLIAFFVSAATLAAATGWASYTAAAGRLLACAGTVFGQTWAEAGNYGSSWDHAHTGNTWTGGTGGGSGTGSTATGTTGGGTTGGPDGTSNRTDGANSVASSTHGHSIPGLSIPSLGVTVGSLSVTGVTISGNTTSATFIPPLHSLVMGQKS